MANHAPPPHPGSYWQECQDMSTGYPYYWNTINNQVVWECPIELLQYRQSLVTRPPPLPPPPPSSAAGGGGGGLVAGYGSDSEADGESGDEDEGKIGKEKPADEIEKDPEFIGPKMPKKEDTPPPEEKKSDEVSDKTTANDSLDDLMAKIEAEQPPDYQCGQENEESTSVVVSAAGQQGIALPQGVEGGGVPPPPPPMLGPPGIATLISAYSDSDTSDQEEETKPVKSHFKAMKGQMDSSGKLHFGNTHSSWQTAEQKAALASYNFAASSAATADKPGEVKRKPAKSKEVKTVATGRKQRLALPGGKFNKADSSTKQSENEPKDLGLQFVKSSSVLPGSEPSSKDKNGQEDVDQQSADQKSEDLDARVARLMAAQEANMSQAAGKAASATGHLKQQEEEMETGERISTPSKHVIGPSIEQDQEREDPNDISKLSEDELAEELVEKLQHFKVNQEKISSLKLLAVKIETLYSAWCAGALSKKYLKIFLENAHRRLLVTESAQLSSGPWTARWDRREKRYEFVNTETGVTTHIDPNSGSLFGGSDSESETQSPPPKQQQQPSATRTVEDDPPCPPTPPLPYTASPSPTPPLPLPPPMPTTADSTPCASPQPPPPPLPPGEETGAEAGEDGPPLPPSSSVNNEPEDMDMSDDDMEQDDDDGIPLTPPTPSGLQSDSDENDDGVDGEKIKDNGANTNKSVAAQSGPTTTSHASSVVAKSKPVMISSAPVSNTRRSTGDSGPTPPGEDKGRSLNLTDELSSFYSEIGFSDPLEEEGSNSLEAAAVGGSHNNPDREIGSGGDSGPSSPSASPAPKKRKKNVKVSNSLSMKKKGINSMLTKWQNIK